MIAVKNRSEVALIAEGGRVLAKILEELKKIVKPGLSTAYLNRVARGLIFSFGAKPSFEGYRPPGSSKPYPAAICASLNNVVVHGIPSENVILNDGDILKLDLGINYKNLFSDGAITLGVGDLNKKQRRLIETTQKALEIGIAQIKPGNRIGDIGAAVADFVESQGLSVIKNLIGHGVGFAVHEEPDVPNYGKKGAGLVLKPGVVLAIEPMVALGGGEVRQTSDGFGYETVDGSLSAHFEHTVAVIKSGCAVLTSL